MRRRWHGRSLSRQAPSMVLQSGLNTGAGAETAPALSFEGGGFRYAEADPPALGGLDLEINAGEMLAVAGGNGSGKSTLARLANGLLVPGEGQVCVQGLSTADPSLRFDIHSRVGLLFQNPEDQIVGASVEDDVAFGLENLSVPREEMRIRVAEVLGVVGLEGEERTEPHLLSGGQMQRLALASVLVMRPALLVLDEPTSMLDSRAGRIFWVSSATWWRRAWGRFSSLSAWKRCWRRILCWFCRRDGRSSGAGRVNSSWETGWRRWAHFCLHLRLRWRRSCGRSLGVIWCVGTPRLCLTANLRQWCAEWWKEWGSLTAENTAAVVLDRVCLEYNTGSPFAREALADVSLEVPLGRVSAVAGPTAAGKTTLLELMAGLIPPGRGSVSTLGSDRPAPGTVGMVLQRPEVQLFSANVWDDVAAAPRLCGVSEQDLSDIVRSSLTTVGLDVEAVGSRSPLALSVGEQRRVAIAGILSLSPSLLILDEPGAGLDPKGRLLLMESLLSWVKGGSEGTERHPPARTLVFSSHDLDEVAAWADNVIVLSGGRLIAHGPPADVLVDSEVMSCAGLEEPLVSRVARASGITEPSPPVKVVSLAQRLREMGDRS